MLKINLREESNPNVSGTAADDVFHRHSDNFRS